jgi:Flp pilus assembly CpaE family ATPase
MLVDADVYGGAVATMLGLLDESPGIAAASRQAANGRLDPDALAELCWSLAPGLRVLTGLPRADRWPELRATGLERMLAVCRSMADFTVVDTGFCLETDEELSFDTAAPRRNGATLAVLDAADVVLAVGSADALGLARLVRGLEELREAQIAAPVWVVLNRVRSSAVRGSVRAELTDALVRFGGQPPAAFLPLDHESLDAAVLAGAPVADAAPGSPFRAAVVELAAALCGRPAQDPGRRRGLRGGRRSVGRRRAQAR